MKLIIILSILFITQTTLTSATLSTESISSHIASNIDSKIGQRNRDILKSLYQKGNYSPLWIGASRDIRYPKTNYAKAN